MECMLILLDRLIFLQYMHLKNTKIPKAGIIRIIKKCMIMFTPCGLSSLRNEERKYFILPNNFIYGYMEGRKEMFYLMTHSTHFILRLYGIGHMVKDHLDSETGNPLLAHGLLFPINSKGSFICTIPQTR